MIRALTLACATLFACAAAHAAPPVAVEGAWTFTTGEYHVTEEDGFRYYTIVSGDLVVRPSTSKGAHDCSMRTKQNWFEQQSREPPIVVESMSSVQTCKLKQSGDKVTIVGTIVTVTDEGYLADDFTLTVESDSRMTGQMLSRWRDNKPVAKALFQRGPGAIS